METSLLSSKKMCHFDDSHALALNWSEISSVPLMCAERSITSDHGIVDKPHSSMSLQLWSGQGKITLLENKIYTVWPREEATCSIAEYGFASHRSLDFGDRYYNFYVV